MSRLSLYIVLSGLALAWFPTAFAEDYAFDAGDEVVESRRGPYKGDLVVTEVSRPVRVGSNYQVHVVVKNIGMAMARASTLLLRDNYTSNSVSQPVAALGRLQSVAFDLTISSPDEPTTCYLSAIADFGNRVAETVETNNVTNYVGNW